ncbi:trypsin-7-like [Ctenocephalides felis]|uniref:trypsin-7-like n=1 Tax=Ctenocephalides felis TaxID=7515 RepID=UPI000E6E5148|nr:trypsin-7-like [Ctenocephalides felis]
MMFLPILLILAIAVVNCAIRPHLKDSRIVGGYETRIEDHPHQVSIMRYGWHSCGGSIIGEEWILTAAHCTASVNPGVLSIRVGSSFRDRNGTVIDVAEIFVHPKYNAEHIDYDYSLLRMAKPIRQSISTRAIMLPQQGENFKEGLLTTITGWGTLSSGGPLPSTLQAVAVPLISTERCSLAYGVDTITDRMICAGVDAGGKDSCQGDSGGPMIANGKLIGIVSWGRGCAQPKVPGVYAKVADQRDWIKSVTRI